MKASTTCTWAEGLLSTARTAELRKANRYRVSAPVHFLWVPQHGEPISGLGVTRDVTPSGVFVVADTPPSVGSLVQLEVFLPKFTETGKGMHLNGEGVVLRVETGDAVAGSSTERGFAASVQFYPDASEQTLCVSRSVELYSQNW